MMKFAHCLAAVLSLILASIPLLADEIADANFKTLPPHPRLFADAARFQTLKAQNDPVSRQMVALLRDESEKILAAGPVTFPSGTIILGAIREVQGRILTLAMMYRLTGEKRFFEGARTELLTFAAREDWGPSHFLGVGEACFAAGIGLDWLHDDLSSDDREWIASAIVNFALLPSLEVNEVPGSWVNGDFNWNQVCHAGLSVGALAVAEREPELARKIVDRAVKNVPTAGAVYAPDGSYPEGPSYWSYGTTFHVMLIEALRGTLGTSCGLEALPGFLKGADFKLQMVGPTGDDYNFSDYHKESAHDPVMVWLARELNRSDLATTELKKITERHAAIASPQERMLNVSRHLALELLWWQPSLAAAKCSLPLHWTAGGHLPIAVIRSAWDDPRATFVAVKGGTPNQSHGHMDAGSFILEDGGVRWALDLGSESYNKMRAAKIDLWNYSQESTRWKTFRCGPEAHNIMRFDGARQNVEGKAEIRPLPDQNGVMGDVVELSALYKSHVESARRTVKLFPDLTVSIEDEWKTGAKPVEYAFQWLTKAKVTRLPSGVRLEQSGESLELRVDSPGEFQIEIEDQSQAKAPQDTPNPNLSRIVIRQKTDAEKVGKLSVRTVSANPSAAIEP